MEKISREEVEAALFKILQVDSLKTSPNLQKFLSYIVEQKLSGNEIGLKAYSIAIDAFGRSEDFDSQLDPIVRVQARRLRTVLQEYYQNQGARDAIRFDVPRGSYKPEFIRQDQNDDHGPPALDIENSAEKRDKPTSLWQSLAPSKSLQIAATILVNFAVLGLVYTQFIPSAPQGILSEKPSEQTTISVEIRHNIIYDDPDNSDVKALQFMQEFRQALSLKSTLSIVIPEDRKNDLQSDFIIENNILGDENAQTISVELINNYTGKLVWGQIYDFNEVDERLLGQVIRDTNAQVSGASIRALEGRAPSTLTAPQLFVLATWVSGPAQNSLEWQKERVDLARLAVVKDPEFGPAYSVLADKLAYLAGVDGPSDTLPARLTARQSAQKALELNAHNVNTIFNIAQYYWHAGRLHDSIRMQKRVLDLDPNHGFARFLANVMPYTCDFAPDSAVQDAIAFDQSLGANNPSRWLSLSWISWLHFTRNELEQALEIGAQAAQIYQIPYSTLRQAVILNQLDRPNDAASILKKQKKNWPNLDPNHFAKTSVPRICRDEEGPGKNMVLDAYRKLAEDVKGRM